MVRLKGNGETESLKPQELATNHQKHKKMKFGGVRNWGGGGGGGAAAAAGRRERRDRDRFLKGNGERLGGWGRVSKGRNWPPTAKKTRITTTTVVFPTFSPKKYQNDNYPTRPTEVSLIVIEGNTS